MALMENKVIGGIIMTFKQAQQRLFSRWHEMLVDDTELMQAIKTINAGTKVVDRPNTFVRNAYLVNKPERWYISCFIYNKEWPIIKKKLEADIKSIEILR